MGYLMDEEGPQNVNALEFEQDLLEEGPALVQQKARHPSFRYKGHWAWWT